MSGPGVQDENALCRVEADGVRLTSARFLGIENDSVPMDTFHLWVLTEKIEKGSVQSFECRGKIWNLTL